MTRFLSLWISELLAGVLGSSSQLLLDTENLVVLGQTLGAARRSGLDLTSGQANDQVGNKRVLGLTGTMRHHRAPASALGELVSIDGFGDTADLVDLKQQAIASLLLNSGLDSEKQ